MATKILIVEDRFEEQEKARQVVELAGYEAVCYPDLKSGLGQLKFVDGVLSDMFFLPAEPYSRLYSEDLPSCGVLVVIAAMTLGKPVSICTDGTPEGHHGQKLAWIFDAFVAPVRQGKGFCPLEDFPFGWNDRKDWADALEQLIAQAGWIAPNSDWRAKVPRPVIKNAGQLIG